MSQTLTILASLWGRSAQYVSGRFLFGLLLFSLFTASAGWTQPCSISVAVDQVGACDNATGYYTVSVTVTYANPPATGFLKIADQTFDVATLPASPAPLTLSGLIADGKAVNTTAFFTAAPACADNDVSWTAPAACKAGVIATLRDELSDDNNQNNKANPNDSIKYTIEILNNSGSDKTGVAVDLNADPNTTVDPATLMSTPLALPQATINTLEDTPVDVTLTGWDINDVLSFSITGAPAKGSFGAITPLSPLSAKATYTPSANANGADSFTFTVTDGDSQTDATTLNISITPVNDAPSFACGPNQTVLNSAGAQTATGWATGISDGDPELTQGLTFMVTSNSNSGLFSAGPAVDPSTGNLTYTPAAGAGGIATITLVLKDNGGTANGGVDQSASCMFTIEVQAAPVAVNDAPASNSAPGSDFHTALNTALNSSLTAGTTDNLMANDNRGFPLANVVSYGVTATSATAGNATPTTQGGSVTVTAAGEFTYTPPSATFTGLDQFIYRIQNAVGSSDATVTIAVGVRPSCTNDSYTASANVPIVDNLDAGVLENDQGSQIIVKKVQGAEANVGVETAGATAGLGGSTNLVILNANGTFRHAPAAGVVGAQTFTYTIQNGFGETPACTVTVTTQEVSGKVAWFIDPSQAASSNNYGTFDDPFETIAAFNAVNLGGANQPGDNDVIYLDPNGTYNEADGINLRSGQELYGGLQQFSAVYAATTSAEAALASEYSTFAGTAEGTASLIATTAGNGVDLNANNKINGVNIGNTPNGFGLAGTNVGTPAIGTMSTPMSITGTGGTLNITTGDLGSAFFGTLESSSSPAENLKLVSVTGNMSITSGGTGFAGSPAANAAVLVSGGTVTFVYPGAISKNNTNHAVHITGKTGGAISFHGNITATTTTANAINLASNTGGTTEFKGVLALTTTSGVAFNATGAGSVVTATNVNSTTVSNTGIGVNISETDIGVGGVTFKSVNVNNGGANSAVSGIVLENTGNAMGAFFKVLGDGTLARNGSGGTIDRTTDDAVRLLNANNVTLQSMNLSNNGDTAPAGADATTTTGDHSVQINSGSNVVLSGVYIQNPKGGVLALDLGGTNRINNNSRIEDLTASSGHAIYAVNTSTTMTLFELNNMQIVDDAATFSAVFFGTNGTGNMSLSVDNNCIFEDLGVQAITAFGGQGAAVTGVLTSSIKNSQFRNAKGVGENNVAILTNGGTHNATVETNTFNNIAKDGTIANTSVLRTQNNGGKLTAVIKTNTFQNIAYGVGAGGRHLIGHIFEPLAYTSADFTNLDIDGNTASNITFDNLNREAIFIDYRANSSNGNIKIRNNTFNIATAGSQQLMELRFRPTNASTVNVQINSNNVTGNTVNSFLDIDAEDAAIINATVNNNTFTNSNGTPGQAIDVATEDPAATGGPPTMCVLISANTLTAAGNSITLNEAAGTMNVATHANAAAVGAANGGATVTVSGTPTFGVAPCALPSN